MSALKQALLRQTWKVITALITWGIGVILMTVYCLVVMALNRHYGQYVMIVGAMLFLTAAYFLIDLWWNYKRCGFRE